jgi:hypothetical protein
MWRGDEIAAPARLGSVMGLRDVLGQETSVENIEECLLERQRQKFPDALVFEPFRLDWLSLSEATGEFILTSGCWSMAALGSNHQLKRRAHKGFGGGKDRI